MRSPTTTALRDTLLSELTEFPALRWKLQGLGQGSASYLLARVLAGVDRPTLVVVPDPRAAEDVAASLRTVFGESAEPAYLQRRVHLFPAREAPPFEMVSPSVEVEAARVAALYQLRQMRAPVIVACPESLAVRVLPREQLDGRARYLVRGEIVDLGEFCLKLEANGYRRVGSVEESSEYAVRGGIVDLWSPGSDYPCRLELFGDELESLRFFDPADQCSFADAEELVVLPASPFGLGCLASSSMREAVSMRAEELLLPTAERRQLDDALRAACGFPGYELLLPYAFPSVAWIGDYLPDSNLTVVVDPPSVEQAAASLQETLAEARGVASAAGTFFPEPAGLYVDRAMLDSLVTKRPLLELDMTEALESSGEPGRRVWRVETGSSGGVAAARARMKTTKAEEGFAGIARELQAIRDAGNRLLLVVSDSGQIARLEHLLTLEKVGGLARADSVGAALEGPKETIWLVEGQLEQGFSLVADRVVVVTEKEIFGQKRQHRRFRKLSKTRVLTALSEVKAGDYLVHLDHGIGLYRGLKHMTVGDAEGDFIHLEYAGGDRYYLPVDRINLVERYSGGGSAPPTLDRLGSARWTKAKKKVKEAIMEMAAELLDLEAWRAVNRASPFERPGPDFEAFEAGFPFEETEGQVHAIRDVIDDLCSDKSMDRLVCGDVGYGKTEVGLRAAYLVAMSGRQVAFLVPTTVLARQHYETVKKRFADYPIKAAMLSRFNSKAANAEILAGLAAGTIDVVIGTHRMLQKDVEFARLGLLVVDEEHRFGVKAKEQIKRLRREIDILTLTATPIPRTLQMAIGGVRDLSLIETAPVDRLAIRTYVARYDEGLIRQAVLRELGRGGQVFYVHNRVSSIEPVARRLAELVPEARVVVGHGQMPEGALDTVMTDFMEQRSNVLVCTSIIESGLDIANANTIIVNRADTFGLAQLYQIRGRVGRSHRRAYAYLLVPTERLVVGDARRRLEVLQELDDLGSGFRIAAHDMEIRGAGNLLGKQQSGQITAVGFDLYMRMLEEAIQEARGRSTGPSIEPEIDLGAEAFIPEGYIDDVGERLLVYKRMANADKSDDLLSLADELVDRFGPLPRPLQRLLRIMGMRPRLKSLMVESVKANRDTVAIRLHERSTVDREELASMVSSQSAVYRLRPDSAMTASIHAVDWDDMVDQVEGLLGKLQLLVRTSDPEVLSEEKAYVG